MLRLTLTFLAVARLLASQETISLLALDRQGQPVVDLKADELQVVDSGQTQPIASFGHPADASAAPLVILYDLLNTASGARGNVPQQIAQSLQRLEAKAPVYLYLLAADGMLTPVRGLSFAETPSWPRDAVSILDGAMHNASVVRPKHLDPTGARVKATYEAIGKLYKTMDTRPGRKTIIWITHGVPLSAVSTSGTPVDYLPMVKKFAGALGREQVVIYPVQQTIRASAQPNDSSRDTLQQFADLTGGRLYSNENIEKAVTESLRDAATSYVLTYSTKADGKYHALRITCTRSGVHIQARQGYFAEP
jgi:VWFA-related protein